MNLQVSTLKLVLTALLLTVGLFAPASSARQAAGVDEGHPQRKTVVVQLGAVDKEGQVVEGLKPEDLSVKVEGKPQSLISCSKMTEEPLHVVILLDASVSQERVLPFVQGATDRLAPALLTRGGSNDVAVVSFTGDAKVVQGLTADADAVRRAIASVEYLPPPDYVGGVIIAGRPRNIADTRAGTTAIWDALVAVCDEVFAQAKGGRRAVILVTDGVDTSSRIRLDKAVERLLREGVAVYSVGVGDEFSFEGVYKEPVRKVSERTGGRAIFPKPKKPEELPVAFEQIRRELLNSYALTFAAPVSRPDGKPLKLRVELVNPELRKRGVQLAYPQSLFD